ncbi:MAG: hypothetical protein QRY74_04260 [Chlamydia sp.]
MISISSLIHPPLPISDCTLKSECSNCTDFDLQNAINSKAGLKKIDIRNEPNITFERVLLQSSIQTLIIENCNRIRSNQLFLRLFESSIETLSLFNMQITLRIPENISNRQFSSLICLELDECENVSTNSLHMLIRQSTCLSKLYLRKMDHLSLSQIELSKRFEEIALHDCHS